MVKPVTDSGEVRRKEEKKSNLFWPVGIAVALGLVFAGIFSFILPNLQQSASSGVSTGASAGNQPQQPAPQAPVIVGTETPTQTPIKAQEPVETFKDNGWYKLGEEQYFEVSKYKIKLKLIVTEDKILVDAERKFSLPEGKDIQIKINLRKDGVIFQSEILKPWNVYKAVALPPEIEWQPEIAIIYKTSVPTPATHELT